MTMDSLGIRRVASLHVFVRDLERSREHYVNRVGLAEIAVSTPEFEREQRARASVIEAGRARFVLLEPLGSRGESFQWLRKHPEGIGRIDLEVGDVEHAFAVLVARGATIVNGLQRREVAGGRCCWFDIASPLGDTLFRFSQAEGNVCVMPGLARVERPRRGCSRFEFGDIDHITSNFLTLQPAIAFMCDVMGLKQLWEIEFHSQSSAGPEGQFAGQSAEQNAERGTGLKSIVMYDPESGVKFANNEPRAPNFHASQIYLYCEDHRGPGVQHVALTVDNLVEAVRATRALGARFMPTPATYYEMLPERLEACGVGNIDEDIAELQRLEILVDGSARHSYLLQVFMQEAAAAFGDAQAGPFFVELIQRKGDQGFGGGNFRALFDSIERQQQLDGRAL